MGRAGEVIAFEPEGFAAGSLGLSAATPQVLILSAPDPVGGRSTIRCIPSLGSAILFGVVPESGEDGGEATIFNSSITTAGDALDTFTRLSSRALGHADFSSLMSPAPYSPSTSIVTMTIRSLLTLSAILWMLTGATDPTFATGETLKRETQKKVTNVEVKLVRRNSAFFSITKNPKQGALFSITNNTEKPIRVYSGRPDKLWPTNANVEYQQKGQWENIGYSNDMVGQEFLILPGKTVKFEIPVFDVLKKGMVVRARINSYYSDSFVW